MTDKHDETVINLMSKAEKAFNSSERSNAETQWARLAEYIMPNSSGIFNTDPLSVSKGTKLTKRLYDTVGAQANLDLASSIQSTLTNPATKWSTMRFKDPILNNNAESVEWLQQVSDIIHDTLNESNFDGEIARAYQNLTGMGTMCLLQEAKYDESGIFEGYSFKALHLAEIAISTNQYGVVDTLHRRFELSAKQSMQMFGKDIPPNVREALGTDPEKPFSYYHLIFKRPKKEIEFLPDGSAIPNKRPYASVYIEKSSKKVVEEGGYYEFPAFVPRWGTLPGEVYGRGPGHIALPNIISLNQANKLVLQAAAKAIDPPLITEAQNILSDVDFRSGKITIARDINAIRELTSGGRFDVGQLTIADLRQMIEKNFFIDKLLLPPRTETGEMTAFEVSQRLSQMLRVIGPTISRLNSELLKPLLLRSFSILHREGAFPPLPTLLQQVPLAVDIQFVNQLSRAQQLDELNTVQEFMTRVAESAQVKPEALDWINIDGYVQFMKSALSVPESLIMNEDDVKAIRAQRAQQAQQQQALDAGVQAADIASKTGGVEGNDSQPTSEPDGS